jgi:hypothetical protein
MHTILEYNDTAHHRQVIALWETVFGDKDSHNKLGLSCSKKRPAKRG